MLWHICMASGGCVLLLRESWCCPLPPHPQEENGKRLGVFTLSDESKILISNFLDFQQACSCRNIIFSQFLLSDPGPTGSSYVDIVCLLDSMDECDLGPQEVVLTASDLPFSVMTTLGFIWIMSLQSQLMYPSSIWRIQVRSLSHVISMSVCLFPFCLENV